MSASTALLEEKLRRAMSFGKYLDQHPDNDDPLHVELVKQTCMYRIALANLLQSRLPKEKSVRKTRAK